METARTLGLMLHILFLMIAREFVCGGRSDGPLVGCLESDRKALIDFKRGLNDPHNVLLSWKGNNCCQWWGVTCESTSSTGAVIGIDLHKPLQVDDENWYLGGEISPSLANLKSLRHLDLSSTSFNNTIPIFFGSFKYLEYLNLSYAEFEGLIPPHLGNLSNLRCLDVSFSWWRLVVNDTAWVTGLQSLKYFNMDYVDLSMVGPDWIQVLNKLPSLNELHLSHCRLSGYIPSLPYVNLTSLHVLVLSFNTFNSKILNCLLNISSLVDVDIKDSELYGRIPLGFSELPNLKSLNLANNHLRASCSQLFRGRWESIQVLHLAGNQLHGRLPASIGNMTSLIDFDISINNVHGGIPASFGKLCNLKHFSMPYNHLNGTLPESLEGTQHCLTSLSMLNLSYNQLVGKLPEWLGQLESLIELRLENNLLHGPIPSSLGSLQNLNSLRLGSNRLNGTLPNSLGQLSQLSLFDVSSNYLTGLVTETHFLKLHSMEYLLFSSNSLILNVSSNWVPPFQVRYLDMASCHIGPSFPVWLKSQKKINSLDISNASLSGPVPAWFWEVSSNLYLLRISSNKLEGQLPSLFNIRPNADVDFSSNLFEGTIPYPNVTINTLDLSNNKFSGRIPENAPPFLFISLSGNQITGEIPASFFQTPHFIWVIDLSNNNLVGSIPSSIGNYLNLQVLDLSKNNLSGNIPHSLGDLKNIQVVHLNDNNLSGEIPSSLRNWTSLESLDLGHNILTGRIPRWIGEVYGKLRILRLRSNAFFGEPPSLLSNLTSLQVLDLAENRLNGSIPLSFGDLVAMSKVQERKDLSYGELLGAGRSYKDWLVVMMQGQPRTYTNTLSLVVSLDLSGNDLGGQLPPQLTKLSGLMVLNLSRNHISGTIPENISELKQLLSLDLSSNRLSGPIPQSLASLSFLGYMNLSNNELSGMIPYAGHLTTFNAPSFAGNPGLCGAPLDLKCPGEDNNSSTRWIFTENDDQSFFDKWFYLSVGLGFAVGILAPFLIIAMKKSWSEAYFGLVDKVEERIILFKYRIAVYYRYKFGHN